MHGLPIFRCRIRFGYSETAREQRAVPSLSLTVESLFGEKNGSPLQKQCMLEISTLNLPWAKCKMCQIVRSVNRMNRSWEATHAAEYLEASLLKFSNATFLRSCWHFLAARACVNYRCFVWIKSHKIDIFRFSCASEISSEAEYSL